jgi:hypothetical protein
LNILPIPIHQTKQFPLPAMHTDRLSLKGTLQVLSDIITKTLKLSGDGLESMVCQRPADNVSFG